MSANDKQVGGSHYKTNIEPWDAILDWGLGYLDGSAVKYLSRWHKKGGIQDIEKAIHFLQKLIEVENVGLRRASSADEQIDEPATLVTAQAEQRDGARPTRNATNRDKIARAMPCRTKTGC